MSKITFHNGSGLDLSTAEFIPADNHAEHLRLHNEVRDRFHADMMALQFPRDRKEIAWMPYELKMDWYAHQFKKDPQQAVILFSTKDFQRFWKWRVLIPLKVKRFYYRLKNGELFKRYPHISEMKKKMKRHAI